MPKETTTQRVSGDQLADAECAILSAIAKLHEAFRLVGAGHDRAVNQLRLELIREFASLSKLANVAAQVRNTREQEELNDSIESNRL